MYIETDNLIIRDLTPTDADVFAEMAADGTLTDDTNDYEEQKYHFYFFERREQG